MTVTSVSTDEETLTLTLIAEFDASVERVWQLWADPRQLERWWGPPSHPATVEQHDLTPGGTVTYYMTSPEGERYPGWWGIVAVDPPTSLEAVDGFADADGEPDTSMPTSRMHVRLLDHEGGTRMELRSSYETLEGLRLVVEMGVEEGIRQSVGQMDALLAE